MSIYIYIIYETHIYIYIYIYVCVCVCFTYLDQKGSKPGTTAVPSGRCDSASQTSNLRHPIVLAFKARRLSNCARIQGS